MMKDIYIYRNLKYPLKVCSICDGVGYKRYPTGTISIIYYYIRDENLLCVDF